MLASLPMYDLPEVRAATDAFWEAVAKAYGVSGGLTRGTDLKDVWRSPDMLFSQTCGYPFTHEFREQLTYVATPHYNADGCEGPFYCSLILAREAASLSSFRGRTAAYNSSDSMSGCLALKLAFAPDAEATNANEPFFASRVETGGHVASLAAVKAEKADVCAVDCVTIALLRKHRPEALEGLVEIARSPAVPGLPFVTRRGDARRLQDALGFALRDNSLQSVRETLLIEGMSLMLPKDYDVILSKEKSISHIGVF